jgi:hypothetical protein
MSASLTTFIEALMTRRADAAACCLSSSFTVHDGLAKEAFIAHEIDEFRQRLLLDERSPTIQASALSETRYEIRVVAGGLVYATDFEVDDKGLICSNDNPLECVPKLRRHKGRIDRAAAVRGQNFLIQTITPRFPVSECHVTTAPQSGLFSYLQFSNEIDPAKSFTGSLRVMMRNAGSVNMSVDFPGLEKFADWQEKEFYPIIDGSTVKIPMGKSRPWNASAWLDDGSYVSIDRPEPGLDWALNRPVKKAMITDALDNDWVVERER